VASLETSTVLALGPHVALSCAKTAGVPLFERCPPSHTVLLGRARVEVDGRVYAVKSMAIPANVPHRLLSLEDPFAGVAYLDTRRYGWRDVQRLARTWEGFVPGQDDVREALGDAIETPEYRVDGRLLRALDLMQSDDLAVPELAGRVGLSSSRLTHLMTDTLGIPPRTWRTWFRLQGAIRHAVFSGANLTQAAHAAGFSDSAHLTRTCKRLMGVRPAKMLPQVVHVSPSFSVR